MEMYVGLTDFNWYKFLISQNYDEVNFWKPGIKPFKALRPNDLFLFKLKKPYYAIVGGGFFAGYSQLPCDIVWETFSEKNGTVNKEVFYERVLAYKRKYNMNLNDFDVGCIVLSDPFFFREKDWITPMRDWSKSIVQGKKYDTEVGEGKRVYEQVLERINKDAIIRSSSNYGMADRIAKYYESMTKHRIGQGAFRVIVTDAYSRECAITGERALPVLQAAHIKAFAADGPNEVNNGILLRSDIHTLFDRGYITINAEYRVDVSKYLKEEYGTCGEYYKYHGKKLRNFPAQKENYPLKEYLQWHNDNVFKG